MKKYLLTTLIILVCTLLWGQKELYKPLNIQNTYVQETRDMSGLPGKKYWQNKPEYIIDVKLDPATGQISGSEKIKYQNNSPDTLHEIVLTVLADFYNKANSHDFNISQKALNDGVHFSRISVNGRALDLKSRSIRRSGTNLLVKLDESLHPGQHIQMEIDWDFNFPKNLAVRCGDYGDSTFFAAYFFPKIAVYDDIDGWDRHQYTGLGEFFGEYSDFDVHIRVPKNFKIWASGELQNPEEVFTPKYHQRWVEAQKSMEVYHMINAEEYLDDDITLDNAFNSWHFTAKGITDFAFATSDKFLWDIINVVVDPATGRKTTFNAAYRVDSKDYYKMAALGKSVLEDFSSRIPGIPYPYPEMTIFNANSGMEFPMMCNNVSIKEWKGTVGLAYHESAHTYFPFYVGTNERKYAWMDEGWASFFPMFYLNKFNPDFDYFESRKDRYYAMAGKENEASIMTLVDLLTIRGPYRQASYNKSFFAYHYLYDYLGETLFTQSLKGYMLNWAGKHPMPYDFFNSINTFSGQDLNWYWQNWFFEKNHADMRLVKFEDGMVYIANPGRLFLPVHLEIEYEDGSVVLIDKDMSIWKARKYTLSVALNKKEGLKKITLGNGKILDVDVSNNVLQFN